MWLSQYLTHLSRYTVGSGWHLHLHWTFSTQITNQMATEKRSNSKIPVYDLSFGCKQNIVRMWSWRSISSVPAIVFAARYRVTNCRGKASSASFVGGNKGFLGSGFVMSWAKGKCPFVCHSRARGKVKAPCVVCHGRWGKAVTKASCRKFTDDDELMLNVLRCHLTY